MFIQATFSFHNRQHCLTGIDCLAIVVRSQRNGHFTVENTKFGGEKLLLKNQAFNLLRPNLFTTLAL
jgi:hypothetical protein